MFRRPRFVFVLHMFGHGGTDRVCAHLARGFAEAGIETEILVFSRGGDAEAELLRLAGGAVRVTFLGQRGASRALDLIGRALAFVAHIRRVRPDCVVSSANHLNWLVAVGARLARVRDCQVVLKITNPVDKAIDSPLWRRLKRLVLGRIFGLADRVLTLADSETRALRPRFPHSAERFVTVRNPYATVEMFAPPAPAAANREKLVLAVGRLARQKRLDLLIETFSRVTAPHTRLVILGEGPERAALTAQIARLGLTQRVDMPGYVADPQAWYARADAMVLTSVYEGLPAVVLEAMAANCPVISTDCFLEARALIAPAEGCAVAPAEPQALAEAIDACLAQPRPMTLCEIAGRYSVESGVHSHLAQILPLLGSRAVGASGVMAPAQRAAYLLSRSPEALAAADLEPLGHSLAAKQG